MNTPITEFHLHRYGCIQDLRLENLGRLQAFIGPNGAGKSTILRGIQTLCDSHVLGRKSEDARAVEHTRMSMKRHGDPLSHQAMSAPPARLSSPSVYLRLDPDAMREPSPLIADGEHISFLDERGRGLASVYDTIQNRGDDTLTRCTARLRTLFPAVKRLGLRCTTENQKELQLELTDGTTIRASALGRGLLLFLAFAALPYIDEPPVLLVEEPENGLHPARVRDVLRMIREASKTTQVFMTTNSPLVVNELEAEEVFVTTLCPNRGTRVTRLDRTPDFEKRSSVYSCGELWLAYADGDQEAALLSAGR